MYAKLCYSDGMQKQIQMFTGMSNSGTSSTRGVPNTRSLCLSWAGIASPHRHLHSHHHHHHHHHMIIYIQVGHSWRAKEQLLLWCGLRPRRDGEYCSTFVFVLYVLYLCILFLCICISCVCTFVLLWSGMGSTEMNNDSDSCQWIRCIGGGAPNWNICFASNFTRFQYIALWWLPNGAVGGEALSALLVQPMTSQGLQRWRHQHHLHQFPHIIIDETPPPKYLKIDHNLVFLGIPSCNEQMPYKWWMSSL